jgi:hypothetical protein
VVVGSAEHGALMLIAPFVEGATKIMVEIHGEFDISDASETTPVTLVHSAPPSEQQRTIGD